MLWEGKATTTEGGLCSASPTHPRGKEHTPNSLLYRSRSLLVAGHFYLLLTLTRYLVYLVGSFATNKWHLSYITHAKDTLNCVPLPPPPTPLLLVPLCTVQLRPFHPSQFIAAMLPIRLLPSINAA